MHQSSVRQTSNIISREASDVILTTIQNKLRDLKKLASSLHSMAGIRTKPAKLKALSSHRKELSSEFKKPLQEPQMRVRRDISVGLGNTSSSSMKSETKSFGSLLKELEKSETMKDEEQRNTIISRGPMGEREITFTVGSKKKRRGKKDDDEDQVADGEDGRKRKERDSGRKKQRFEGRRSASNNVLRKLG
ncbi:uncharacterized protein V1513DRAFT_454507 [Lipomyces chichibuensis]|uniref:uncharacterized protein n=1 Tax=Lipomyces chichibuensis TaxID=1546026 RepID=UPI003343A5B9